MGVEDLMPDEEEDEQNLNSLPEDEIYKRLIDTVEPEHVDRPKSFKSLEDDLHLDQITVPLVQPEELYRPERCAYLLRRVKLAGHPDNINKSEMARLFDIARRTIFSDMSDHVLPSIRESVGDNHMEVSQLAYNKAIQALLEEGKYEKAARVADKWNDWLSDRGVADREPDKIEINQELLKGEEEELEDIF